MGSLESAAVACSSSNPMHLRDLTIYHRVRPRVASHRARVPCSREASILRSGFAQTWLRISQAIRTSPTAMLMCNSSTSRRIPCSIQKKGSSS